MTKRGFVAGITALLVAVVVVTAVAAAGPPPAYFVDESKLPFDALLGTTTARYWGVHGGAGYRIEVPANWNGDLVLYGHGFRGTGLELTVDNPRIRQWLVTHGYAWAASSYSKNGYDVKQGVKDTHALGELFNGLVGNPARTYITGHSMGGHITGVAIEQYPYAYVGALPMCGVMGDNELFDYFLDFNYGRLLLKLNRLPESKTHLDRAAELVPQSRAVRYERAKLNFRLRQFEAARQDAEAARELADPAGAVLVHLGGSDFLRRYKIYIAHVQEWRQQFQKLDSVDLRYDRQVIVNPDSGPHSPAAHRPAAPAHAPPAGKSVAQARKPASAPARKPSPRRAGTTVPAR